MNSEGAGEPDCGRQSASGLGCGGTERARRRAAKPTSPAAAVALVIGMAYTLSDAASNSVPVAVGLLPCFFIFVSRCCFNVLLALPVVGVIFGLDI